MLYLPTRTLTLLDALCAALPAHTLLAADFDALPDTSLPGVNAPLVATTVRPDMPWTRRQPSFNPQVDMFGV